MPPVTYGNLKDFYETYEWDPTIGNYGGFVYTTSDKKTDKKPIKLDNISMIIKCDNNINYSKKEDTSGLSKTTIELDNVPIGSFYGWDHSNNAWIYYINDIPSYYSNYII
jgi:hypothetical protein